MKNFQFSISNFQKQQGFTLLEIMVSLSIFMVVMTISMGAILNIYDANRKARAESVVMGNLNLAVETMTREMRFGRDYDCGSVGAPLICASGDGEDEIRFTSEEGVQIVYKQDDKSIVKSIDNGVTFLPVTAPEVIIESLSFYVLGAEITDDLQPRIVIKIKGNAGEKLIAKSEFALQTMVSQRKLDNGLE